MTQDPPVVVVELRRFRKGTLCAFLDVKITAWNLVIHGCSLHEKSGSRWCQLPGTPRLTSAGEVMKDSATGKVIYSPVLQMDLERLRKFSDLCVAAALLVDPDVFDADDPPDPGRIPNPNASGRLL